MHSLEEIRAFCKKYGKRPLILDTNLLILLLVGLCDKDRVSSCELTSSYSYNDCELLYEIFKYFKTEIIVTPHVIAELSNLTHSLPDKKHHYFFSMLVSKLTSFREEQITISELLGTKLEIIVRFGFPDLGILETAKRIEAVILTNDSGFSYYANSLHIPCIGFENVRGTKLLSA